jgi:superfamily II DNA helicase RecQ
MILYHTRSQAKAMQAEKIKNIQRLSQQIIRPVPINNLDKACPGRQSQVAYEVFEKKYGFPARVLQVHTNVSLLNKKTTFLLAGTGYGKSRIPELFRLLHTDGIVLLICPLDALGDDQVSHWLILFGLFYSTFLY